jgi:hypothetical protein
MQTSEGDVRRLVLGREITLSGKRLLVKSTGRVVGTIRYGEKQRELGFMLPEAAADRTG